MNTMASHDQVDTVQTASLTTDDPASFELALRPWELLCRPGTRGEFKHSITLFKTPLFSIYRESFNLAAQVQGLSPAGTLVLAIPLGVGKQAQYWRNSHTGNTLPSTLPGPLEVLIRDGHCQLVIMVDLDYCRRCLDEQLADALLGAAAAHKLPIRDQTLHRLVIWGQGVLDLVQPDPLNVGDIATIDTIMQELVHHLSSIAAELKPTSAKGASSTRLIGMRRALEYLRHNYETRVPVSDLLKVADISERSLQYAFRETFGMSPLAFMKRRRLHFARQQLLTACHMNTSVSTVATGLGFYELGRFASDYRQTFGQFPSETLRNYQAYNS
jgi:AraC family ethanolamine operon transcriptional activator